MIPTSRAMAARVRQSLRTPAPLLGPSPWPSPASATGRPAVCSAINARHFDSVVFVVPADRAAIGGVPRWVYRALTVLQLLQSWASAAQLLPGWWFVPVGSPSGKGKRRGAPAAGNPKVGFPRALSGSKKLLVLRPSP
jgi:hypothetical protein